MRRQLFVCLVFLLLIIGFSGCRSYEAQTVISDHSVTVSNEWMELRAPRPLVNPPDWYSEIFLSVPAEIERSITPWGLRFPDGALIKPEIEIVSGSGDVLRLDFMAFWGPEVVFDNRGLWGTGRTYSFIRIRSPHPITISRIVWHSYDPREVKR